MFSFVQGLKRLVDLQIFMYHTVSVCVCVIQHVGRLRGAGIDLPIVMWNDVLVELNSLFNM